MNAKTNTKLISIGQICDVGKLWKLQNIQKQTYKTNAKPTHGIPTIEPGIPTIEPGIPTSGKKHEMEIPNKYNNRELSGTRIIHFINNNYKNYLIKYKIC